MNSIKQLLTTTLILITIISEIGIAQNIIPVSIIGNWESVNSENNRVQVIKFDDDSTFYFQSVLSAEYSYRVIGNKMIAKLLHSSKTIIDTTDIIIKKDTLISIFRRNGSDEVTTMVKIPGALSDSIGIAGDYLWKYPNAHTAYSKFTNDGIWIFRLPVDSHSGKYKISSDSIIISYTNLPSQEMKFWINNKVLIITDSKTGSEMLYKKVDYFVKE